MLINLSSATEEAAAPAVGPTEALVFGFVLSSAQQLLVGFLGLLAIIAIYHQCVAKGKPGDWFETHAVANGMVVLWSIPSIIAWAANPSSVVALSDENAPPAMLAGEWYTPEIIFHQNNHWAIMCVIAVHTYHCMAFPLSKQDIFHHFMFVPTIGVYGGFGVEWGPVRNCVAFFISGLPGGIDYVVLTLVKRGYLSKLFQKRLGSKINLWVRGPGIGVLLPFTCYLGIIEGKVTDTGTIIKIIMVALLCGYNGIHYMEMAIRNYQLHLTTTKLTKRHELELQALTDSKPKAHYEIKEQQSRQQKGVDNVGESIVKMARALSVGTALSDIAFTKPDSKGTAAVTKKGL